MLKIYSGNATEVEPLLRSLGAIIAPLDQRPAGWHLVLTDSHLELQHSNEGSFSLVNTRIHSRALSNPRNPLAQACGARPGVRILDGFGGWGTDGLTLALQGCDVTIVEKNPMIFALLYQRAMALTKGRSTVLNADVTDVLQSSDADFDVVYLDPMFPPHPKTAKPTRAMQVLQELAESADLKRAFDAARGAATDRVVLKCRSGQAPLMPDPDWSVKAKAVRFDVYRTGSRE